MINGADNPLNIAILVRMFPNIVQTYVLNHIVEMINIGANIKILAEVNPHLHNVHPDIQRYDLIPRTTYTLAELKSIVTELLQIPLFSTHYLGIALHILFSPIWFSHGAKYGIKALVRARVLANNKIDIVHSHSLFCSHAYLFLKEVFNIPITTTFHGLVPNNVEMLEPEKIKAVLERGDAFFVNTRFAEQQLLELGGDKNKIHIIPQGTNTSDFPFKPRKIETHEPVIILSVGRLSVEKGFHIAIKAIANLVAHKRKIEYRIIGSGLEEAFLRQTIAQLGLQHHVKILGAVSTEHLRQHYADAHIFVLPSINMHDGSHTETQGVVLQEAQCSGLPVIASMTGGIPEIIRHGSTGLLFNEGDDAQLAQHIAKLIDDPDLYTSLCTQGRQDVEDNYSTEVICQRLLEVYQCVLDKNSRS